MAIYGIGTDLCEVARFEKSLARDSFVDHVFSQQEQALLTARTSKARTETAAANWAAKEAFTKAAGTGLAGFTLRDIAVLRQENGAPYFACSGTAAAFLAAHALTAHLSISHDGGMALAFVVLETTVPEKTHD